MEFYSQMCWFCDGSCGVYVDLVRLMVSALLFRHAVFGLCLLGFVVVGLWWWLWVV